MVNMETVELLKKYNQVNLLNFYNRASDNVKEKLRKQISHIDFEQIIKLYENIKNNSKIENSIITPMKYIDKEKIPDEDKKKYEKIGNEAIQNGKLAVITMAGGQGTRLGHMGPKGTFILDEKNNKSLFQILCESLKNGNEKYRTTIPWYIMTSKENNDETEKYFAENNFFGYPKEKIKFFIQDELPVIDTKGNLMIGENGLIKEAANGHGGVFEAAEKNGIIEDMKKQNIEWIFIGGVDNPLIKMVDPIFMGICIDKKVLAGSKSIVKKDENEKVGIFCRKNNKPYVIEYTEISKEMAEKKDENNEFVYGEAHVLFNLFNIKSLENLSKEKLPYHAAFKKNSYMNEKGEIINPEEPNSYKFEAFLFDAFERLDDMVILRVKRDEEFAPVKNKDGEDSPDTSRKLYYNYLSKNK